MNEEKTRELIRKIKCSFCGKERIEKVILREDESDDYFDDLVCDKCEKEYEERHKV